MPYLLPSDLAGLDPNATSSTVVEKWISKAEIRLASQLRKRGANLVDLATDPDKLPVIKDVLENAVLRVLRNPEGLKSESEGDYSYTANPLDASGNVWFPADDLDLLAPADGAKVGTILTTLPRHRFGP